MRSTMYRWLLTASLTSGSLLGISTASAQPEVRDHRTHPPAPPPGPDVPREAPPPPRVEKVARRNGWVWIDGNWEWRHGRWEWQAGRDRQSAGASLRSVLLHRCLHD